MTKEKKIEIGGRMDTPPPVLTKRKKIGGRMDKPARTKGKKIGGGWRMDNRVHTGAIVTAKFNGNGDFFFTGGKDGVISLWNSCDGEPFQHFIYKDIRDVCISKDDKTLASCAGDGKIFCYDLETARSIRTFSGHTNAVNAIKFNEFGSVLVTADSCVRLWDIRSQTTEPIKVLNTFKDKVTSLCLTRTAIIAGSLDGTVQNFELRKNIGLSHNVGPVKCISMAKKDDTYILASCTDSTFQLLHVFCKEANFIDSVGEFKGHTCKSSKLGCCFTNEDSHVVGGSEDGRIFIWNIINRYLVATLEDAHSAAVTSLDYHPTKNCMISAAMDGTAVLWKDPKDM